MAKENKKSKGGWIAGVIIALLGGAILSGGAIYFWQQSQINDLDGQLTTANRSLDSVREDLRRAQNELSKPNAPELTDDRILLTATNVADLQSKYPNASADFVFDEGNSTVKYVEPTHGLQVDIPVNDAWASDLFRVEPFEVLTRRTESSGGVSNEVPVIEFGPFTEFEGGGWVRTHSITVEDSRSTNAAIAEANSLSGGFFTVSPTIDQVGDKTVVKYSNGGLCGQANMEVIGEDYNYVVTILCRDDFDALRDIVKTMEFI